MNNKEHDDRKMAVKHSDILCNMVREILLKPDSPEFQNEETSLFEVILALDQRLDYTVLSNHTRFGMMKKVDGPPI